MLRELLIAAAFPVAQLAAVMLAGWIVWVTCPKGMDR